MLRFHGCGEASSAVYLDGADYNGSKPASLPTPFSVDFHLANDGFACVPIALLIAPTNLEYYLKQTILLTMEALDNHDHVNGLDEVYERAQLSNNRILEALREKTADHQTIRNSVFSNLVSR